MDRLHIQPKKEHKNKYFIQISLRDKMWIASLSPKVCGGVECRDEAIKTFGAREFEKSVDMLVQF